MQSQQDDLRLASQSLQRGDYAAAAALVEAHLRRAGEDPAALRLLGTAHLWQGDADAACASFERLVRQVPEDADALRELGVAQATAERLGEARDTLEAALRLNPDAHLARLHLGRTLQRLGEEDAAVVAYYGAIHRAQLRGRWLGDDTTPPLLREMVRTAMQAVDEGRRRVFDHAMADVRARHGRASLSRVEAALEIYLGERAAELPDPQQKPLFLYVPGLPPTRFFARELFPWLAELEASTAVIRAELEALLAADSGFEPFLGNTTPEQVRDQLSGTRGTPAWNAFFFYRHGERYAENCARCPQTAAVLERLPLVRIRDHAPEICFSLLTPGSHILPHSGVTNTRVVCHLPLIVPADCSLVVGGEARAWQEGQTLVFDDTFVHEAWNRSEQLRVVLLLDLWNPHLSQAECDALATLVGAIGDFNASAGVK